MGGKWWYRATRPTSDLISRQRFYRPPTGALPKDNNGSSLQVQTGNQHILGMLHLPESLKNYKMQRLSRQ